MPRMDSWNLSWNMENMAPSPSMQELKRLPLRAVLLMGASASMNFAVSENKIGELVVKLLGSRLIMSLVNAVFNMKTISKDDIVCTYSDNTLTVDFTDVIKKSKAAQFVIKDRNLFDIVNPYWPCPGRIRPQGMQQVDID